MKCKNCNADITKCPKRNCPTCGEDIGYPHVREVEEPEEVTALTRRYEEAFDEARKVGAESALKMFEEALKDSGAVINVDVDYLHKFVTNSNVLYSTYDLQVQGQTRKTAERPDDKKRRTAESMLFGEYGEEIRYAALSLNGSGLESYGVFALKLREITVAKRSVTLEKNSFHFLEEHNIKFGEGLPPGYRATWNERHKLAVAKHAKEISAHVPPENYVRILLASDGDRTKDRFIEVHIYGAFDNHAIEAVKAKTPKKKSHESALIAMIKEYLKRAGKAWVEA